MVASRDEIRKNSFVQFDETPFQVLNEPGKRAQSQSYLWVLRDGPGLLSPSALATAGFSTLLSASDNQFHGIQIAGAEIILYLGITLLRSSSAMKETQQEVGGSRAGSLSFISRRHGSLRRLARHPSHCLGPTPWSHSIRRSDRRTLHLANQKRPIIAPLQAPPRNGRRSHRSLPR
ncbi:MAG TPA: hypothetical protein EYQ60_01410 [Myxococcales bacterium]|nr:hypothetical protein [Myxococcales bacterium]HIK84144.1 hypothetical protein [Myxococcales bacterium]